MMSFLQKKKNKFCLKLKTCYVSRTSNLDFEVFVLVPDNSEMIEALENIRCFSSLGANRWFQNDDSLFDLPVFNNYVMEVLFCSIFEIMGR